MRSGRQKRRGSINSTVVHGIVEVDGMTQVYLGSSINSTHDGIILFLLRDSTRKILSIAYEHVVRLNGVDLDG